MSKKYYIKRFVNAKKKVTFLKQKKSNLKHGNNIMIKNILNCFLKC